MTTAPFNHGTRVLQLGDEPRPIEVAGVSDIGAVVTAPNADPSTFPLNEPIHFYTHETDKITDLGETGTGIDIVNAVKAQGIEASLVFVRVEEGADADATRANMIGSAASQTGVHALTYSRGFNGIEPDLLLAPGFSNTRISNAKNPVADALEQVANKLKAIAILDGPNTTKEDALAFRADFSSRYAYLVDPHIKMAPTGSGSPIIKPASPFVAGLFAKRDKQKGGPYWSPSNQDTLGVLGTARPVSYFDGEIDHEANFLNENGIATFIPSRLIQNAGGGFASNGRILWGNRTTSEDPLWAFVNVVRTRSAIERSIVNSFNAFMDQNLTSPLAVAIIRSVQEFLDELIAVGAILGGRAFFERDVNPNANLRSGKLRVEFDAEEVPPLEDLIFGSRRNEQYFDTLAEDIQKKTTLSFSTDLSQL